MNRENDMMTGTDLAERFFSSNGTTYDQIANLSTLGLDIWWKKQILNKVPKDSRQILDQACGTGILTFKIVRKFPHSRVIGQAGVLDSARFEAFIAWELGVSVKDVTAMTLGGHGDDMVALVRYASVKGIPVMEILERKYKSKEKAKEVMEAMVKRTRGAGGEVVALLKTGSAFYSPASSAIAMAEAILKDSKRVLPTCAYLNGEFGVKGYYVGVPCVLGAKGIEQIIEFALDAEEQAMMDKSVAAVKGLVDSMK